MASQTFTASMGVNVSRNSNIMKLHAELIFHKQNRTFSWLAFPAPSWGCVLSATEQAPSFPQSSPLSEAGQGFEPGLSPLVIQP